MYIKMIETSMTWKCPKSGTYKIVCVAGGESGAASDAEHVAGGATSFGNLLVASGNWASSSGGGGGGGYTILAYGGMGGAVANTTGLPPITNGGGIGKNGIGYGAGGGITGTNDTISGGGCGKMIVGTCYVDKNTDIICTVGKGGVNSTRSTGNDGVIIITEV